MNDPTTGLNVLIKQPNEARQYDIPFTQELRSGDTIASITSVTATKMGLVTEVSALTVGTPTTNATDDTVQVTLSVGTDGEHYKLETIVVTNDGDVLEVDTMLYVAD